MLSKVSKLIAYGLSRHSAQGMSCVTTNPMRSFTMKHEYSSVGFLARMQRPQMRYTDASKYAFIYQIRPDSAKVHRPQPRPKRLSSDLIYVAVMLSVAAIFQIPKGSLLTSCAHRIRYRNHAVMISTWSLSCHFAFMKPFRFY